jgi:hypothetical protein
MRILARAQARARRAGTKVAKKKAAKKKKA